MTGSDAVEMPETEMSDEQFQQEFWTMQQMLGEPYKDKKVRDAASSSKTSKKDKGKCKADKLLPGKVSIQNC